MLLLGPDPDRRELRPRRVGLFAGSHSSGQREDIQASLRLSSVRREAMGSEEPVPGHHGHGLWGPGEREEKCEVDTFCTLRFATLTCQVEVRTTLISGC